MPLTSDHFPHAAAQQTPSRPAPDMLASASDEPRPQESSWSQQAFVSPSMSTTTTPIMNWMQAFTTPVPVPVPVPVRASSQHSLLYEQQFQYPTVHHSTLSLLAGLTTPFAPRTEAFNYQTGLPPQQQQHPTREYSLHEPLPSSMVLSLPSPSYPQTPIPHRPLQKRPNRDEVKTIPGAQEFMAPLPVLSKVDEEEDGMSMTQELLTSPLAESPPQKKRKAPSSTKKKPSSHDKKRKVERTPPSPKLMLGPPSEVDVLCIRHFKDHPGNTFYNQLVEKQARTLAKIQWELNQNQNTKVESAGFQMGFLEMENKDPSLAKEITKSMTEIPELSRGIVDNIRQRNGRFLFKQNDATAFHDIGDLRARRKTVLKLQKAVTAWLKEFLKAPPQEEVLVQEPHPQLKKSSKTLPKKKGRVKESPDLDKTLVKIVAGILNIPPPLESILNTTVATQSSIYSSKKKRRVKESPVSDSPLVKAVAGILNIPLPLKRSELINTRVATQSSISSSLKDWNPKESPELDKTLVKTVAGIANIPPPLEPSEFILTTRGVATQSSISSPLKDWNLKESPEKLDKTLVKTVAGILNILPPLEQQELILNTSVAPHISIASPLKEWRLPSRAYDKEPSEDRKPPSRCQEQEPYRLFVPPPQIPNERDLPHHSSNRLEAADFQLQKNSFFQRHYHESILLRPPQIPTEGDLPEISNLSPAAASLPVSKLSTRPNPNNRLEPTDFRLQYQRYQEQLHRLLPPFQMPADGNLPQIATASFDNTLGSNFSPAATSLLVSKLSTRPNSSNSLEPTECRQNLFTQQHFTQDYQHDFDDDQDWFCAYDSR